MRISDWSSDVCSSDLLSTRQAWERAAVAAEAKPRRWERSGEMSKKILIELGDGGCNGRMIGRMATGAAGGSERQPMIVAIHGGGDRKSVVKGKRVYVRVVLGGRRIHNKQFDNKC